MLRRTLLATAAVGFGLLAAGSAMAAGMDKVKAEAAEHRGQRPLLRQHVHHAALAPQHGLPSQDW